MAIAGFLDHMCLALRASGLWLRYATLQNLIPSFPWIAPPRPPPWRNPRKGRDQILPSGNHVYLCGGLQSGVPLGVYLVHRAEVSAEGVVGLELLEALGARVGLHPFV